MRCTATELEIETIYNRIKSKDINLQPDFQRGEVWSIQKKRKLIDSILRGWKIPPIHVIETPKFVDEVLDGQQRLATIRDFIENGISVDGALTPFDNEINKLDGLKYSQLDVDTQRRFRKYSVTIIRLTQFKPEEPAELFYRLNQPATLTSAEQRNAFIGETRNQIRELVVEFEGAGANRYSIGFSNSRMAYDDIISKFCYTLETGTIKKKITSTEISEKYRQSIPFSEEVFNQARYVLLYFADSINSYNNYYNAKKLSLNKATLFSWLIFTHRHNSRINKQTLAKLVYDFEYTRQFAKGKEQQLIFSYFDMRIDSIEREYPFFQNMLLLFNQRASMGSTDATSIIYRDIILELFYQIMFDKNNSRLISDLTHLYIEKQNFPQCIEHIANQYDWGDKL